jgi:hypothetical protein
MQACRPINASIFAFHLGDVVEESDGDLMGDGVNIGAAHLTLNSVCYLGSELMLLSFCVIMAETCLGYDAVDELAYAVQGSIAPRFLILDIAISHSRPLAPERVGS